MIEALGAATLCACGVAYAVRAVRLAEAGRPLPTWRLLCFAAGIAMLAVAVLSPLEALAEELITAHMVQHLLILDIAALLIVLGLTGPMMQPLLAIRWLPLDPRTSPTRSSRFAALGDLLYVWHIPALYQAATFDSDLIHALQHLSFFFAGVGVLDVAVRPAAEAGVVRQRRASAGFVIAVRLIGAVLANVLMWSRLGDLCPLRADRGRARRPSRSPTRARRAS